MKSFHLLSMASLLSLLALVSCSSYTKGNDDPNFKNGIYVNNHIDHPDKSILSFWKMRLFGDQEWAEHEQDAHLVPTTNLAKESLLAVSDQVTWFGHSTFLVQIDGINILTDPVFSDRASPVSFAGPQRYTKVALPIEDLPRVDVVVISHNHYDHLDELSIKKIGNQAKYYVPSGLKAWFVENGIRGENVHELKWWQSTSFRGLTITATPSQHWSARSLFDKHTTHWASWLLTHNGVTTWFAGDTGYNNKDFVDIGRFVKAQKLSIDLALIPIGAYGPRHFMKTYHVDTKEAVQIHKDLGAKLSIGMHWGAFPLTSEWPMEPYEWLNRLSAEDKIGNYPFETLKIGETLLLCQNKKACNPSQFASSDTFGSL